MRGIRQVAVVLVLLGVAGVSSPGGGGAAWAGDDEEFLIQLKEEVDVEFFLQNVSVAAVNTAIFVTPAASARSIPFAFGTSAE